MCLLSLHLAESRHLWVQPQAKPHLSGGTKQLQILLPPLPVPGMMKRWHHCWASWPAAQALVEMCPQGVTAETQGP